MKKLRAYTFEEAATCLQAFRLTQEQYDEWKLKLPPELRELTDRYRKQRGK